MIAHAAPHQILDDSSTVTLTGQFYGMTPVTSEGLELGAVSRQPRSVTKCA